MPMTATGADHRRSVRVRGVRDVHQSSSRDPIRQPWVGAVTGVEATIASKSGPLAFTRQAY